LQTSSVKNILDRDDCFYLFPNIAQTESNVSENPFSTNPYSSPNVPVEYYSPPNFSAAEALRGPSTGLIVVSIIWLVVGLTFTGQFQNQNGNAGPPDALAIIPGMIGAVLQLGIHGVVLYGALQMRKVQNIGLAYTAAIISCIPCCSGCYIVGIPFGIWALIVLNRPEVRSAFR
jgi:hypothetical protein